MIGVQAKLYMIIKSKEDKIIAELHKNIKAKRIKKQKLKKVGE